MYSLDAIYYKKEFATLDELIEDVINSGMDPSYEVTKNGVKTGDKVIDLIQF